jgi:hypothetical protein
MRRANSLRRSPNVAVSSFFKIVATAAIVATTVVVGFSQTVEAPAAGPATPSVTATPSESLKPEAPEVGVPNAEAPRVESTKPPEAESPKSAGHEAAAKGGVSANVDAPKPPKKKVVRRVVDLPPTAGASVVAVSPDETVREYEIRLEAHRRELLQREAALEKAERKIAELTRAKAAVAVSAPAPSHDTQIHRLEDARAVDDAEIKRLRERTRELEDRLAAVPPPSAPPAAAEPPSTATPPPAMDASLSIIASLRQELDVERENRTTLEKEIQRLMADSQASDQAQLLSRSLDSARAEILVLNHRLAEEQATRESLEVTIERIRESAGIAPSADWLSRFDNSMKERKEQADRLQEQLHGANEAIVALKAQLEATPKDPAAPADTAQVAKLESENKHLHDALEGAQQANADLRTQAELASRLAELLYGQPR